MHRKRERLVALVDQVPIEAQVLQRCDRLPITVLDHAQHEVLEASQCEPVGTDQIAVEVLEDDRFVVVQGIHVLYQSELAFDQEGLELVEIQRSLVQRVESIEDLLANGFHPSGQAIGPGAVLRDEFIEEWKSLALVHSLEQTARGPRHDNVGAWIQDCFTLEVLTDLEVFHFFEDSAVDFFLQNCDANVDWRELCQG